MDYPARWSMASGWLLADLDLDGAVDSPRKLHEYMPLQASNAVCLTFSCAPTRSLAFTTQADFLPAYRGAIQASPDFLFSPL